MPAENGAKADQNTFYMLFIDQFVRMAIDAITPVCFKSTKACPITGFAAKDHRC
jgi:hypothetical protein